MSRPRERRFNNQDWQARKAEKQKQWEQRQAEKAKRQAEWETRKAARKAEYEARRKAQQELAAARKAEREKRRAERAKEIARKRAEIAQRKRERLERQRRELERLSNKSETFTKRVSFMAINDGKPYLVDEDARLLYGIRDAAGDIQHAEGEVVFEDATNPQELLRLGKQKLKEVSKPQVAYEAEVVNLGRAGFDPDGVNVGDAVQIVDTTFTPPIRVEGRVLKIEEDLLDSVDATRITLGNIHESYTQKRRAQEQKLDALIAQSSEWNAVADGNGLYVRDLIGRVNDVMNGVGGFTYLKPGEGITVYDKPENQHPTRAIQLGGGFWRTANSRKPNGDWDWKNIASGEGIFANAITTGKLMDAQGRNSWNLDTGEFSLQASAKIGGKTVKEIVDDSADSVISKMSESLTQEAIFNKLTNGGQTQGIYLSGGQVYLNASYLKTGSLNAGLIKAGRIQDYVNSNWWDLTTSTIHISRGEIGGMTIANNKIHNRTLSLDEYGMHFMSGNNKYGRIGIIDYMDYRHKVLFFGSRSDDCLIGFGIQSNGVGVYGAALTYSPTSFGTLEQGLNFSADCNFEYHKVSRAGLASDCVYEDGANMDSRTFYLPTSMDKDGTAREWVPVTFGFRNGFVI